MRRYRPLALLVFCAALLGTGCNGSDNASSPPDRAGLGKADDVSLNAYENCSALEADLKALAAAEIRTYFDQASASDTTTGAIAGGETAADYTNNQVAGVDEADLAKTDGSRLFLLNGGALHRFDIAGPGTLQASGSIDIEGLPRALLLEDERLLVFSLIHAGHNASPALPEADFFMLPELTKLTLLEWRDNENPAVLAERYFDGYYLTARNLSGAAFGVLHGRLPNPVLDSLWEYRNESTSAEEASIKALADLEALSLDDLLPRSYLRNHAGELIVTRYTESNCADFRAPDDSNGRGITSLVSLDIAAGNFTADHIVSNPPVVYVSPNHVFLAEAAQNWWWFRWNEMSEERANIHAFTIDGATVDYKASARVTGLPDDSFALDEHENVLRIATWVGRNSWWNPDLGIKSLLHTLEIDDDALTPLGELRGIAPGEGLFAARFVGDRAYLVTFEMIDPLFTVDLSDPRNPEIQGELKVPGFSTYLHPIAGDRLLAVGVSGDETGATWNTVISLFGVSDMTNPALITHYDLATDNHGWNWSEALYEHKAFQYDAARELLAVPLGASRSDGDNWQWRSSLELIRVDNNSLTLHGSVDHSAYFDADDHPWYVSPDIRRSFFIADHIYVISDKAITVHAADNPAVITADALLPGPDPVDYFWID